MDKYNDLNEDFNNHPDKRRKMNAHRTFRRSPRRLLSILCTFNLCPGPRKIYCRTYIITVGKTFQKKSKISKFSSKNLRISSLVKHLFQPESSIHGSWFCVLYSRFWLSSWYKNFIIIFNPTWSEFFIALKTWWRVEGSGFDSTPSPCCSSADLMLKNGQYIY